MQDSENSRLNLQVSIIDRIDLEFSSDFVIAPEAKDP
jgi:hypothetical protein